MMYFTNEVVREAVRLNKPVAVLDRPPKSLSPPAGWKFLFTKERTGGGTAVIAVPGSVPAARYWRNCKRSTVIALTDNVTFAVRYVNLSRSQIPYIWDSVVIELTYRLVSYYDIDDLCQLSGADLASAEIREDEANSALELARLYKNKYQA